MASGSKSSTESKTTTANQQVGASEGAVAAGAGATVNIENLSDDVARAGIDAVVRQGDRSSDVAEVAIDAVRRGSGDALDFAETTTRESLGFGRLATTESFDFARDILQDSREREKSSQAFAQRASELVAAGAGVTSPANVTESQKQLIFVVVAIAGIGAFVLTRKK